METYSVSFSVPFVQGKQRPRFDTRSMRTYTPNDTKKAEKQIRVAYEGASLREYGRVVKAPKGVPVTVSMRFYKKAPKSWPAYLPDWIKPKIPFVVKIDVDNGIKCGLDSLNGIAWHDDAQVVLMLAQKMDRAGVTQDHTDFIISWEDE